MGATLDFSILGNHCLLVHNNVPISDVDWAAHVDAFARVCAELQPGDPFGVVVLTEGEGPNARQRGMIDAHPEIPKFTPAAVLSVSPLTRGIITALNWMGRGGFEAFKPSDYARAFDHVKLPRERHFEALRLMLDMKKKYVNTSRVLSNEELLTLRIDELRARKA